MTFEFHYRKALSLDLDNRQIQVLWFSLQLMSHTSKVSKGQSQDLSISKSSELLNFRWSYK